MHTALKTRILSAVLTCAMLLATPVGMLKAAADDTRNDKYVSEVFIAYGKTEEEARQWLIGNGWEPVDGDLNRSKNSQLDEPVAAVMGIKRTADKDEGITDIAAMNMSGGYSFDDYESLLKEKKAELNEFTDSFLPAIQEYRDNYNGKGSEAGKARADFVHNLLNKFVDGSVDGEYAVNDTGMQLGDLLLKQTRREYGESKYDKLSKNERVQYGDLQQILLEGNGYAILTMKELLSIAADTSEDTWIERLGELSGVSTAELAEMYLDNAGNLSDSAAKTQLMAQYGDEAYEMSRDWNLIHSELKWYVWYTEDNNLWQEEGESDEAYAERFNAFFDKLEADYGGAFSDQTYDYYNYAGLYAGLQSVEFSGEWGDTLLDFFLPEDTELSYDNDTEAFLPLAAVLSDGQRACLEFISLEALLYTGFNTLEAFSKMEEYIGYRVTDAESASVYSGVNRAIFRNGVALTSRALMDRSSGKTPYDMVWDDDGIAQIVAISMYAVAAFALATSLFLPTNVAEAASSLASAASEGTSAVESTAAAAARLESARSAYRLAVAGRVFMCIGTALMVASLVIQAIQLAMLYNRDYTPIPLYIVDEADIVSYTTDKDGNQKKNIDFNQYVYYEVVKCNRQAIGINDEATDGVEQFAEWGCGDAADINGDVGKQWLALYTIKNQSKGYPILADSLTIQTGSDAMPANCTKNLHYFCYTNAANIADEAYSYNAPEGGMYLFWKDDTTVNISASSFSGGQMALAGIGGLAVGILGATVVMFATKKRKETPDTPAAA